MAGNSRSQRSRVWLADSHRPRSAASIAHMSPTWWPSTSTTRASSPRPTLIACPDWGATVIARPAAGDGAIAAHFLDPAMPVLATASARHAVARSTSAGGCSNLTVGGGAGVGYEAVSLCPVEQCAEALADQRPEAADDLQVTARQSDRPGVMGGEHADQMACPVHQRR